MLYQLRIGGIHLTISLGVALIAGVLVFCVWYPVPHADLMGGFNLFAMLIGIDVLVGPALTTMVARPSKLRSELRRDIFVIAVIQLGAFVYGMHTIAMARPLNLVFEVDRFRAVSFADLDQTDKALTNESVKVWSFRQPGVVSVRDPSSPKENLERINLSLQGIESSQRPSWWSAYELSAAQVLARAGAVGDLQTKNPETAALLDVALTAAIQNFQPGETKEKNRLRWLPLVSRKALDWVVIVDPVTARIRAYAHINGFD